MDKALTICPKLSRTESEARSASTPGAFGPAAGSDSMRRRLIC
jgi:hypothetical protein